MENLEELGIQDSKYYCSSSEPNWNSTLMILLKKFLEKNKDAIDITKIDFILMMKGFPSDSVFKINNRVKNLINWVWHQPNTFFRWFSLDFFKFKYSKNKNNKSNWNLHLKPITLICICFHSGNSIVEVESYANAGNESIHHICKFGCAPTYVNLTKACWIVAKLMYVKYNKKENLLTYYWYEWILN